MSNDKNHFVCFAQKKNLDELSKHKLNSHLVRYFELLKTNLFDVQFLGKKTCTRWELWYLRCIKGTWLRSFYLFYIVFKASCWTKHFIKIYLLLWDSRSFFSLSFIFYQNKGLKLSYLSLFFKEKPILLIFFSLSFIFYEIKCT